MRLRNFLLVRIITLQTRVVARDVTHACTVYTGTSTCVTDRAIMPHMVGDILYHYFIKHYMLRFNTGGGFLIKIQHRQGGQD